MPSTPPPTQPPGDDAVPGRGSHLVRSPWNLVLLVPLLMLVTPWFNRAKPSLGGLPFFYWYQFAFVFVGVACVAVVYAATRRRSARTRTPDRLSVDDLDEGGRA